jgi:hypothetical protein
VAVSDLQEILYGRKSRARVHITFINSVVDPDLQGSGTLGQVEIWTFRLVRIQVRDGSGLVKNCF